MTLQRRAALLWTVAVLLALAVAACSATSDGGSRQPPAGEPGSGASPPMRRVLAPIERVEIVIAESFPPQYFLHVTSGLPNGCVRFDRYEVMREGDTVRVTVTNLMPADDGLLCTQLYGTVQHNIALGSSFVSGTTYTAAVNDVTRTFVAQ
ncbi:MAG: hypothetical protein IIC87_07485 [Chloroflexi bacterium]|nr:hypothetical protein [Chloroflexota bacterium]